MTRKQKFNYNQLTLPLSEVRDRAAALSIDHRAKAFWFLASTCMLSFVLYVYAVNATAHNVAMRASLEREAAELTGELATLEFQYISLQGDVTLARAAEYGFEEVKEPLYVSKTSGNSLSFNTQSR